MKRDSTCVWPGDFVFDEKLLDAISDSIMVLDLQGNILYANEIAYKSRGYTRAELMSMNLQDIDIPEYARQLEPRVQDLMLKGESTFETIHNCKDRTVVPVEVHSRLVNLNNRQCVVAAIRDITDRKKVAEDLKLLAEQLLEQYETEKHQREELEEETRLRGLFIDVLGHELRTPLTPIQASIGMLKEMLAEQPEDIKQKLVNNIYSSTQSLVRRLEELLDLARYSRGTFQLNLQPADLGQFIEDAASRFRPGLEGKKQELMLDLQPDLPVMAADCSRLEQVLINLLSNASKFSPDGGKIYLKAFTTDYGVQIEVRDEGIGITQEEQERLFQPYHRVEQDRLKFPGLGLGLSVSRQIVEAHGGKIWIVSEAGKGSTFTFNIPFTGR